jgi:nicotinamidase-related amidase
MISSIWNDLLSEQDKQVIEAAAYGKRGASTFSSRRSGLSPALLIIDMQRLFVGEDKPILEAIADAPTMIGEMGWRAIESMQILIKQCRLQQIPIIYAKMLPHNRPNDDPLLDIVEPLQAQSGDKIMEKNTISVFFQTELKDYLQEKGCDSVILIGNSTSGCIRAAALDAVQYGFAAYVPYECVFDRIEASHKIALLDMWMKYATVLSTTEMIDNLENLAIQHQE